MTMSDLPPLTWLRAFEASARHLSFTRAAEEIHLTQSAVSQHVRSLESFLGSELFVRKTRALALTEAGANYLPVVKEAFKLIRSGTQAFVGSDRGKRLVLQCNLAFSVFWLVPRLHRLYARHPWLAVSVVTPIWDPERHASQATVEIRFGRPEDMSGNAQRLTKDTYFPVCSPGYQGGIPDFETATLFDCAGMTGTWDAWFNSQGKPFERGSDVNLTSTFVISISAAIHGAGISMAHDSLVADSLSTGRLVRASEHADRMLESYFLLPAAGAASTPASDLFSDWLSEEVNRQASRD